MARSPEVAAAKDAAQAETQHPAAEAKSSKPKLLRGPDGFVYAYTDILAKEPGFFPFTGEINKAGFAVDKE